MPERQRSVVLRIGLLLDTHILIRWLVEPRRLSREQARQIRETLRHNKLLGVSAISLIEIAVLCGMDRRIKRSADEFLQEFEDPVIFEILPVSIEIAKEVAALGNGVRDPMDRAIIATARVHQLPLVTADERIIDSGLTRVVT